MSRTTNKNTTTRATTTAHGSTEPSRQDDSMVEDMLAADGGGGWVAEELVPMYKSFKSPHDWHGENNNDNPMNQADSPSSSFSSTPLQEGGEIQAIHQRISDSLVDSNSGHSSTITGSVGTFDSDTMEVDSFEGKPDKIFGVDHVAMDDDPSSLEKPAPPTTKLSLQTLSTAPSTNFGSIVSDASWHNHNNNNNTRDRLYSMPTTTTTTTQEQNDVDLQTLLQGVLENGNVSDSSLVSGDSFPSFEVESLKQDQQLLNNNDDDDDKEKEETEMDGTLYLPAAAAAAATRDSSSFHRVARLPASTAAAAAAASPPSRDPNNDSIPKTVWKIPPLSAADRHYSVPGTNIALRQSRYHSNQEEEEQQQPSLPSSSSTTTTTTTRRSDNRHSVASSLLSATSTQATAGVHNHYMLCRRNQAPTGGSHAMLASVATTTSDGFPASRKPSHRRRLGTQDMAATDVPAVPARPSLPPPPPPPPPPTTTTTRTPDYYKRLLAMGVGQPDCFDYAVDRVLRYGRGRRAYTPQVKDLMDECQRRFVAMGMTKHDWKPNTAWGKDQLRAWLGRYPLTDPQEVSRVRHEIELFKAEIFWNSPMS